MSIPVAVDATKRLNGEAAGEATTTIIAQPGSGLPTPTIAEGVVGTFGVMMTCTTYEGEQPRDGRYAIREGDMDAALRAALEARLGDSARLDVAKRLRHKLIAGPAFYEHWFDHGHQLQIEVRRQGDDLGQGARNLPVRWL